MSFSNVVRIVVPMSSGGCSSGSGFVVDTSHILPTHPSVFFVTNGHVVDGSESSTVKVHTTFEPRALDARIISVCYDADLALLELCPSAREYTKQIYGSNVWTPIQFVNSPPAPGTKITCVGHPLGIERQTQAKGDSITYMLTSDSNTVSCTVAMTGSVCNPGCSGGPALTRGTNECVGMNSFKLRNATDIDGMSGIRPAHVIQQLLPAMLSPIRNTMEQRKEAFTVLKSMLGKGAGNVLQFLPSHVKDVSTTARAFKDNAIGGRSDGSNARTLRSFLRRHVIDIDAGEHGTIRPGGAAVLAHALKSDVQAIHDFRSGRTWTQVRNEEAAQPLASVLPAIPQPPALITMPILGFDSHGTHDSSLCSIYLKGVSARPGDARSDFDSEGGAIVTSVHRRSLYEKAGGNEHEIIYKVVANKATYDVGIDGKVLCDATKTRITLRDVVCRQRLGDTVEFHVLTPDGEMTVRNVVVGVPSLEEIPHVHMVHNMENTQMVKDQKENMNIGGAVITTLRLNHAVQMGMSEFQDVNNRYRFHAIVAHVSPTSPCWGHGGIEVGSVITHINGLPATTDGWEEFCEQMARAVESGNIMLKTKLGAKRGLFCAITN
jgi:S1-C subfamily serine protease